MSLRTNRLSLTPKLTINGKRQYALWKQPDIDMSAFYRNVITESDLQRLDNLAHKFLGDARLWWALALVNNIANPLTDMYAGQVLLVPRTIAVVDALL